ncbi:MAG: transcriptional repressor [Verrucomicrobia bacterium]|nr:transcriptional repressor [Verrucomicrobiota bacterium]
MKDAAHRLAWALEVCRRAQMRPTPIREKILAFLTASRIPVSLEALMQADGIRGRCNATTAYRTLMLFQGLEVIRQVSLPNKNSYFVLNLPGESNHFLICRCCGQLVELPAAESVALLEREVAAAQGYTKLHHELQFFGICPACQKHPPGVVCAKLQPRMRRGQLKTVLEKAN